jgi:hypothetical protein
MAQRQDIVGFPNSLLGITGLGNPTTEKEGIACHCAVGHA